MRLFLRWIKHGGEGWRTQNLWDDEVTMDRKIMRSLLENMEQTAEETLLRNAAFQDALQALKVEIDGDPRVQATVGELQASGRSVFQSFVPHIKVRVRTEEGVFALPKPAQSPIVAEVGRLSEALKSAASEVIRNSRHYRQLDNIINAVVGSSDRFEGIASEFERAGYEVLICLDLSAYAQVQRSALPPRPARETYKQASVREPGALHLSKGDLKFLQALKIRFDER